MLFNEFERFSSFGPMDDDDCTLLSPLEGGMSTLHDFVAVHDQMDMQPPTGLLWAATPTSAALRETKGDSRSSEELMSIPLEYISVCERRASNPRHHPLTYHQFNDGDEVPHGMRVAPVVSRSEVDEEEENMKPGSPTECNSVLRTLNASFSVLASPPPSCSRASSPLTLKSFSMAQDSWVNPSQSYSPLAPPPLSPLIFGSSRFNVVDIRSTVSPPPLLPTSPRWTRQNFPQAS